MSAGSTVPHVSLSDLARVFGRIGVMSFGGPAAQIGLMHKELVDDRPWLTEHQYLSALSFCMLLPGPEAMQLATYAGWRLRGVRGGIIGGGLFVLPGAIFMAALALGYAYFGQTSAVRAIFMGVQATVVVIVIQALLRLATKALQSRDRWIIAGLSFVSIAFLDLAFPAIIAAAGLYGYLTTRDTGPVSENSWNHAQTGRTIATWGSLWLLPIAFLWVSGADFLTDLALFFSRLAVVTFGGAYAVLAYMAQQVVAEYGWITTGQMVDGMGLAETTPGPLILVTQFVGMIAGHAQGGPGLALVSGVVVLWVTFIPCFLWIFTGAPYVEAISSRPRLSNGLSAITAAVVGVILNLSVWFALHVFFETVSFADFGPLRLPVPQPDSFRIEPAILAVGSGVLLMGLRWPLPRVLALAGLAGLVLGAI